MRTLFAILLLLPALCFGRGVSVTCSGGSPCPAAFDATDTQTKMNFDCQGNVMEITNQTTTVLAYGFGTDSSVPAFDYAFVPTGPNAGTVVKPKGGMSTGTRIYVRGLSAITSGTIQAACYYEERP